MLTEGIVKGSVPGMKDTLLIPKSAVLWTGNTSVAYVKTMQDGEPVFQIREITLGEALDNFYILKKGISEGEEVVSAGTFSVDAAAQLLNKQSMMNPAHKEISNNLSSKLSESNRKGLELFIKGYFRLNDDLIQSRHADAAKSASEMLKQLEQLTESGFMVDALSYWQNKKSDLVKNLKMIAGSDDLKMQRKMYKPLSKTIIEIVKSFRIYNKPVYIQFCPMADNNIGATWISETKEILNPYFGNEMLNCGETKEIIGDAK
jgi:Cu(I)/Ag(I) efflux system membrane fusion protein